MDRLPKLSPRGKQWCPPAWAAPLTDENGHTSNYTLNSYGETLTWTDAAGTLQTITQYNTAGLPTQITKHPLTGGLPDQVTKRLYDANNNLDEEDFPDGTKSTWVYNQTWNQPTQYVDAAGQETDYGLDATNGNVLTVTQISHTQGVTNRTTEYTYTPDPTTQGQTPGGLAAARTTASSAWHRRPRRSLCC